MDLYIGADIRQRDGGKLAELSAVVFEPETLQVVSLVARGGVIDERNVVVPIGAVQWVDEDDIGLELTAEQFDTLENYEDVRFIAPPPTPEDAAPDLITDPIDVPDVAPVGAATGIESIAYTPIVEELPHVRPGDELTDGNTVVWATDGELGKVSRVVIDDETHRITGFVVREGTVFTHQVDVPLGVVSHLGTEEISVTVEKAALERSAHA
jgi:uncharacterized protein YrrD